MSCAKCKKTLEGGTILSALEKKWHPDCFACEGCKTHLANQSFHQKDDVPFCVNCWKERFQPKCEGCKVTIDTSEQYTTYEGKAYHKQCFVCSSCKQSLAGKPFCIKEGQFFCPEHV
ncbi:hypothetical protein Ciccas_002720 [Cichlidogyrus casuarinus]|uniref:LIM zinc-binding domain-containing protein n=1 Tax=Cichlidogyrus casuarinus TaxID=1844966 RepID=A0ABD2QGF6_9PLAT